MDWLDLLVVQGTLKSLLQHQNSKASILLCSAFFVVQLSICMVVMVVYSCIKNRTKHRNNRRESKKRMGTYRILRNFWARFKWSDVTKYIIQDKLSYAEVTKNTSACECPHSCLTLCDPMDCSLPGSSVHGILHARILECVVNFYSKGSSWHRGGTRVSWVPFIGMQILYH